MNAAGERNFWLSEEAPSGKRFLERTPEGRTARIAAIALNFSNLSFHLHHQIELNAAGGLAYQDYSGAEL
jgi:hypothetical protein